MKKIILSLMAVMATLSISAQTVHNVIKVYEKGNDTPVATYMNTNDSKYRVELGTTTVTHDLEIWADAACTTKPVVGQTYTTLYAKFNRTLSNFTNVFDKKNNFNFWGYYPQSLTDPACMSYCVDMLSEDYENTYTFSSGDVEKLTYCNPDNKFYFTDDMPLYFDFPLSSLKISGNSSIVVGGTTTLTTDAPSGTTVTWSINENWDDNAGSATVDATTGEVTGTKAGSVYVKATVKGTDGSTIYSIYKVTVDHEYVDLGLPSGTLWAKTNIGADTETDYGYYFAWGETTTKTVYNSSNYKYCTSGKMTKYCNDEDCGTVDNKTTLDVDDDAATENWGSNWRMPTYAEWNELANTNNCTWVWDSANKGYRIYGKNEGYTDKSIFLPGAGCFDGDEAGGAGESGYYWSNDLYTGSEIVSEKSYFAHMLIFSCYNNVDYINANSTDGYREYGQSIRPVYSK